MVIHAGTFKTGTTSFQEYLAINYSSLLDRGVLYPKSGRMDGSIEAHHDLAYRIGSKNNFEAWLGIEDELRKLIDHKIHTILISSECFCRFDRAEIEELKKTLAAYNPVILMCFRDVVVYIESFYKQEVKLGRYYESISNFFNDNQYLFDYEQIKENWGAHFENIVLLNYDEINRYSVVPTLMDVIGIDCDGLQNADTKVNVSLGNGLTRALLLLNRIEKKFVSSNEYSGAFISSSALRCTRYIRKIIRKHSDSNIVTLLCYVFPNKDFMTVKLARSARLLTLNQKTKTQTQRQNE